VNNIWKFSLVFSFTIIVDQLIKASIQGFVESQSQFEIIPYVYFTESRFLKVAMPWSKVLAYTSLLTMFYVSKNVVIYRNKSFFLGLMRTFLMVGLFTVFLDQISLGYIVNYINLFGVINLSIGKVYLIVGSIALFSHQATMARKKF